MMKEFEGRTEQEAIAKAVEELHIEREDFDVEIVEPVRKGLFKKSNVKIRIHFEDENDVPEESYDVQSTQDEEELDAPINSDLEDKLLLFVATILEKMGYQGKVSISFRKARKLGLNIESDNSSIIIGRKGKNLDAIQLLANVYAGQIDPDLKVIIDSENYRMRHEEQLIRMAFKTAEQVKKSGRSRLLEPMNPYERRLVHTALNDFGGVETKSEGEGLYKQIRITNQRH
ncbi:MULTISPECIES: RNA-binding cell elongation regulator Jag/EloR [Sphaerochaeta]|jgi:spoIIIJ-associated protein|uniref:RNA-binding protein KhpB n=2 Tax=root TaxID=1 RepID=A0ABY4DAJ9_9SPIR|nr:MULTISPECIES: RNA-binding cell elongation regulator Jag/EloR [Sphaerochaeta]MDT3357985.1 protein jag [Spirochaetota bacterium]MDD3423346.1 protein jag [Sphaerochaeta sp.]MDD3455436.1 protein jag [Sphaerochaeta sp.]MDD4037075.1 protein jag [Sphaerochaeta sp.]MDX9982881.1 RNA-binding cell elongation regulator Jag/EloR [Sphaerochaeta sp.]